jgi:hypothetical protein
MRYRNRVHIELYFVFWFILIFCLEVNVVALLQGIPFCAFMYYQTPPSLHQPVVVHYSTSHDTGNSTKTGHRFFLRVLYPVYPIMI